MIHSWRHCIGVTRSGGMFLVVKEKNRQTVSVVLYLVSNRRLYVVKVWSQLKRRDFGLYLSLLLFIGYFHRFYRNKFYCYCEWTVLLWSVIVKWFSNMKNVHLVVTGVLLSSLLVRGKPIILLLLPITLLLLQIRFGYCNKPTTLL